MLFESNSNSLVIGVIFQQNHLKSDIRKPTFCIYETKGTDQLCSTSTATLFSLLGYTIPLLLKSKISSLWLSFVWLYSLVCVRPGQKLRLLVFSWEGSFVAQFKGDCIYETGSIIFFQQTFIIYFSQKSEAKPSSNSLPLSLVFNYKTTKKIYENIF